MSEPLTILEKQLIRSCLTTKTDQEISELIERPVDEVIDILKEIIGDGAHQRSRLVEQQRAASAQKKRRPFKNSKKIKDKSFEYQDVKSTYKRSSYNSGIELVRKEKRRAEERKIYKTRTIDWSTMKTVKIDAKTSIVVNRSVADKVAISQYQANRMIYSKNKLEEFQ